MNYVQHMVINKYGKHKALQVKINQYFSQFLDKYREFDYAWIDNKLYIAKKHGWQIKKDIEKMINTSIFDITPKIFTDEVKINIVNYQFVKKKIQQKNERKKIEIELKKSGIKKEFFETVDNIKNEKSGFRYIGSFDLEFWEQDMSILLEFGWSIVDYKGSTSTTHLVVQENLKYKNGQFSNNNRFSRTDTHIVPLKVALNRFQEEFINKTDIFLGHGLTNDFKVLKLNGLDLDISYFDTSDIGAVIMGENDKVSLIRLLDYLEISHDNLHNAANDAEFVLKAFFELGNL